MSSDLHTCVCIFKQTQTYAHTDTCVCAYTEKGGSGRLVWDSGIICCLLSCLAQPKVTGLEVRSRSSDSIAVTVVVCPSVFRSLSCSGGLNSGRRACSVQRSRPPSKAKLLSQREIGGSDVQPFAYFVAKLGCQSSGQNGPLCSNKL